MPADNARFDLAGPKVEVRVTRAGVTLPIASVPNLQPGDRLWLHPALPATQSVHYLMVLVFLRGTTNPPPDNWFVRIEAWDKKVREEGVEVPVPDEAQQAVLFLAPVTGGDFGTLRSAVQGRPGIFVRASQDLNQASFEQARIEKYVASMKQIPAAEESDPKVLQEHSTLIASTLALKPNGDCMKLPPDQQYTCLTQSGGQTLLEDGHGQTIVAALSSGPSSDFINQASYTQLAGAGTYSAYVGAIVDLVRIMGSLHTAQYQYIPALALPQSQSLNLRLNTAPSFHNPKSVIVIGLPAIQSTTPPPLRATDPKSVACLAKPGVALAVEGAPLVYSTGFAHDLILHLNYPASAKPDPTLPQDIPLTADAYKGGLVLATVPRRHPLPEENVVLPTMPSAPPSPGQGAGEPPGKSSANAAGGLTGTVRGAWGFDPFTGPTLPLQNTPGKDWKIISPDPIIAGKDQHVLLSSTGGACIQSITLDPAPAKSDKETWKSDPGPDKPNTVDVALKLSALPGHDPETLHLAIRQFGDAKSDTVNLVSYSEPASLKTLSYHAGDTYARLTGASLDQVARLELAGLTFHPEGAGPAASGPLELSLAPGTSAPSLPAGDKLTAQVALKDGRTLPISTTVAAARPSVALIGKAEVAPDPDPRRSPELGIHLASPADLPLSDALMFSLRSAKPFPRTGQIEIASPDNALHTTLSISGETLILEDPQTILGKLEPLRAFGPSAFGPLRLRAVEPDGTAGDWLPLVTLVRLPTLSGLTCEVAAAPAAHAAPPSRRSGRKTASNAAAPEDAAPASNSPSPAAAPSADSTTDASATAAAAPGAAAVDNSAAPAAQPAACTLTGSSLYLIDSLSPDAAFSSPTRVPEGFVGGSITVPPPTGAVYYLRLRDDPAAADTVSLPAGPL